MTLLLDLPVELLVLVALDHWSVYYRMQFIRPVRLWFSAVHNIAIAKTKFTRTVYENFMDEYRSNYKLDNPVVVYLADRLNYDPMIPSISGFLSDGTYYQCWRKNNRHHRDGGPAIIYGDGTQKWYQNGMYHRDDGPAIIYAGGRREWYCNGKLHRDDGPALIWTSDVRQMWFQNSKLHREDGPAIIYEDGTHKWYRNGKEIPASH